MKPGPAFSCIDAAWQAHGSELRRWLRQRLPDAAAADDVLQDVFLKAVRHGRGFCGLDNPRAWLFQVARTTLIDRLRTAHPAETLDALADDLAAPEPEAQAPVDALAGCMVRVLAELSPEDAAILRACDLQGLAQRDYALQQGLSLAATKSRLLRARQRLRQRLTEACQVRFDSQGSVCCHVPRPPAG